MPSNQQVKEKIMRMALGDWFRMHLGGVQAYSLYLTIPGSQLGKIIAQRESAANALFTQARIATTIPSPYRGAGLRLVEIESALRERHGQLFKNILIALPSARATENDPIRFILEFHRLWSAASTDRPPEINLTWCAESPSDYIRGLLTGMGRTTEEIYISTNPNRSNISPTASVEGFVLAPPKVLSPRAGEVPAFFLYSLAPI